MSDQDKNVPNYQPPYWFRYEQPSSSWSIRWSNAPEPPPEKPVDSVNRPPHYTAHPSGVECIQITEHLNFCLGNAVKYIWRCGLKGDEIEDLKKAVWYLQREIAKREKSVKT